MRAIKPNNFLQPEEQLGQSLEFIEPQPQENNTTPWQVPSFHAEEDVEMN